MHATKSHFPILPPRGSEFAYLGRHPDGSLIAVVQHLEGPNAFRNSVFRREHFGKWRNIDGDEIGCHVANAANGHHLASFDTTMGELNVKVRERGGGWKVKAGRPIDRGTTLKDARLTPLIIPEEPHKVF